MIDFYLLHIFNELVALYYYQNPTENVLNVLARGGDADQLSNCEPAYALWRRILQVVLQQQRLDRAAPLSPAPTLNTIIKLHTVTNKLFI